MMKKMLIFVMLLILCATTASAEPRYKLPDGWSYNDAGQIVNLRGKTYDSVWEHDCLWQLNFIHWGWGDREWMKTQEIPGTGTTAELGDNSSSVALLAGAGALALVGAAIAHKKAKNAA